MLKYSSPALGDRPADERRIRLRGDRVEHPRGAGNAQRVEVGSALRPHDDVDILGVHRLGGVVLREQVVARVLARDRSSPVLPLPWTAPTRRVPSVCTGNAGNATRVAARAVTRADAQQRGHARHPDRGHGHRDQEHHRESDTRDADPGEQRGERAVRLRLGDPAPGEAAVGPDARDALAGRPQPRDDEGNEQQASERTAHRARHHAGGDGDEHRAERAPERHEHAECEPRHGTQDPDLVRAEELGHPRDVHEVEASCRTPDRPGIRRPRDVPGPRRAPSRRRRTRAATSRDPGMRHRAPAPPRPRAAARPTAARRGAWGRVRARRRTSAQPMTAMLRINRRSSRRRCRGGCRRSPSARVRPSSPSATIESWSSRSITCFIHRTKSPAARSVSRSTESRRAPCAQR